MLGWVHANEHRTAKDQCYDIHCIISVENTNRTKKESKYNKIKNIN